MYKNFHNSLNSLD